MKPSLLNEFRFNTLYGAIHLSPYLPGTDFNKESEITGLENLRRSFDTGSFPDFAWSGYAGINGSSFDQRPKTQDRYTLEFTDNLTWIKGRHVVKTGVKMRHYQWLGTDSKNYMGNWTFNGQNTENPASAARTGDSFADWVLGLPANAGRGFPSDTFGGAYTAWQVFVQDDFKVSSRLTLNIGLRYEYTPWATGYRGQTGTFDGTKARPIIVASKTNQVDLAAQPAAAIAYGYLKDLIQTSSEAGLPYSITYPDNRQIAPRFGFAWRPIGETTVLRGGYGIFYEGEYTDGRVNLFMPPFLLQDSALNDRGVIPNRTLADFYLGAPLGSPNSTIGLTPEYTHMRMGYDQHWNFGIQQQLSKIMVADIEYVGNKGSNIQGSDGFNIPAPAAGGVQARRQFPAIRRVQLHLVGHLVHLSRHAAQTGTAPVGAASGCWVPTPSPRVSGTPTRRPWAECSRSRKGPSEYQVPHSFSFSFGYELPFGKGKPVFGSANRLANGVIGGWQLQGIMLFRSGVPYTVTMSRDVANTGVGGQRPNRIGSGKSDSPTLAQWFNPADFVAAPNFTYGNSGLRILSPDILRTVDFSLFKQFQIAERSRLQLRWEAFNLPNTPSFAAPSSTLDTATVGRVTSTATAPRQMQVALKLTF